jgi:hypothetical protein
MIIKNIVGNSKNNICKQKFNFILLVIIFSLMIASNLIQGAVVSSTSDNSESIISGSQKIETSYKQGQKITVRDSSTITIVNQTLKFSIAGDEGEYLYAKSMETSEYVSLNKGQCGLIDFLRICYITGSSKSGKISLYFEVPDFEITQYLDKSWVYVGDKNTMTIDIYNKGLLDCTNCNYTEEIPYDVIITSISGAKYDDNKIYWSGTIGGKDTKIIEYTFIPQESFSYDAISKLTYDNYFNLIEVSAKINNTAYADLELNYWFNKSNLILGEKNILYWNLTNTNRVEKNLTITESYIKLPENIELIDVSSNLGLPKKNDYEYVWAGKIPYNETKTFWLEFIPKKTDNYEISILSKYYNYDSNDNYSVNKYINFSVVPTDIEFLTDLNKKQNASYLSSKQNLVKATIVNYDQNLNLNNVILNVYNDVFNQEVDFGTIEKGDVKTKSVLINFPPTNVEYNDYLYYNISYYNEYGEFYNYLTKESVNIKPFSEISLYYNFSSTNISQGDIVNVSVYLKNNADFEINNIHIKQIIPDTLFFKGKFENTISKLSSLENHKILNFTIQPAMFDFESDLEVSFQSEISYEINSFNKTKYGDFTFIVNPFDQSKKQPSILIIEPEKNFYDFLMSWQNLVIIISILLLLLALYLNSRKTTFSVNGLKKLKNKEKQIKQKKIELGKKEINLTNSKRKLSDDILKTKHELENTKNTLYKNKSESDVRKKEITLKEEKLKEQKLEIEKQIYQLKRKEDEINSRFSSLENKRLEIEQNEKNLNKKYSEMEERLLQMSKMYNEYIEKGNYIDKQKSDLIEEEDKLYNKKKELINIGKKEFNLEENNMINEKIKLEHDKNIIEAQLGALSLKKKNLDNEKIKLDDEKNKILDNINLFDSDKETVEKTLEFLKQENDYVKNLLNDVESKNNN